MIEPGDVVESACATCGVVQKRTAYDVGSGAELSCSNCEWCWGANGQMLKPISLADIAASMSPETREMSGIDKFLPAEPDKHNHDSLGIYANCPACRTPGLTGMMS